MPRKKTKKVVITPQRGAKAKSKSSPSIRRSAKKRRRASDPMWHTSDLDFDVDGRLIILNRRLARAIERRAGQDDPVTVVSRPLKPPPPHPPPPDAMCACTALRFELLEVIEIEEPHSPELEHANEPIQ